MLTYSELEAEEREYEDNARFDEISERFAGEDGSPAFQRSEYASYLAEQAWMEKNDRAIQYAKDVTALTLNMITEGQYPLDNDRDDDQDDCPF